MKARTGLMMKYAPVWAALAVMLLLFFTSTVPSMRHNAELRRSEAETRRNLKALDLEARRVQNLLRALDEDPMTVENELRRRFAGAQKEGEIIVEEKR